MKAILVIELDDEWLDRINTTYDEMFADVTIYKKESLENQCDYSQRLYRCWCPLKPLPQKKQVDVKIEDIMHTEFQTIDVIRDKFVADIILETDKLIALGYNYCIDEILGEE